MSNLFVFIDVQSFGAKNAEIVTAVRAAFAIFNEKILKEQCNIDDFAVVETDSRRNADVVFTRERHGQQLVDRLCERKLSVELLPALCVRSGKAVALNLDEIGEVSRSYDKSAHEIISEDVCRELCHTFGLSDRIGLHPYGSKAYQEDFGLMLSPYSVYNSQLGKEYSLTDEERAVLKKNIA